MMNSMHVEKIRRVGLNRLEYVCSIEGEWSRYFKADEPMWVEYSEPVDGVPDSIAVLPLIGNVIVLASLMDADLYVDEIDRDFYECIAEFIDGFDGVMPDHVHFKHDSLVHAGRIIDDPVREEPEKNLLFFSGGVDATFSLISHLEEKPALVTVWGADIPWDNEKGWEQALASNARMAERHHLKQLTIRSNFRASYNGDNIDDYSMKLVGDYWWPAFQYGIAMLCLAAPLAAGKRKKVYLASSFSAEDLAQYGTKTAAVPWINDHVRFGGCRTVHDGGDCGRYEKVKRICEFYGKEEWKPVLRVCYRSSEGKNCGVCEKCARDMMSILTAGYDPVSFGFPYDPKELPTCFAAGLQEMARADKAECMSFYKELQTAYRRNTAPWEVPPVLRAFYALELKELVDFLHVPNHELAEKEKVCAGMQEQLYRQIGQLRWEIGELTKQNHALEKELQELKESKCWRMTGPLRRVLEGLQRIGKTGNHGQKDA